MIIRMDLPVYGHAGSYDRDEAHDDAQRYPFQPVRRRIFIGSPQVEIAFPRPNLIPKSPHTPRFPLILALFFFRTPARRRDLTVLECLTRVDQERPSG